MTTRTHTRTRTSRPVGAAAAPTRGPGRRHRFGGRNGDPPDGRSPGRSRGRAVGIVGRRPRPDPSAVRRRAEAMLTAPPPDGAAGVVGPDPAPGTVPEPVVGPAVGPVVGSVADPVARVGEVATGDPVAGPAGRDAWSLAVRERMPVWLQARCAVEPRTVAAVAVVLVGAVGFAAQQYWTARPEPVTAPAVVAPAASPSPAATPARVVVDVSGKVRDPGVRRLPTGARVEDALAAAGGVRPGTDTTGLNRARVLVDGEQVMVGVPAQPPAAGGAAPGPGAGRGSSGAGAGSGSGAGPLSLAGATVEQLDGLPGVGPVLAQHIIDFRTARGGFRSVDELRQVDGIGERRFSDLRALVRP
ncbi:helix-hairpin-helix domain-containing protein [Streptomyces sp. H27-H5]|uniref:helix-hairpin-helix domain-containing protein n=1 Tax=Streptomyces sp. H27-H5 TaxID=2996460 RepID=UPI00226DB027|nr:helix-hairpin-helix domain-containing protein [Streptomyces sp. H27-H5]MCY0958368.1 helix-hairpin-helix domain-containing protein [Streptomyces sp. H27-H5]